MICEIIHDPIFLSRKSEPATSDDLPVVRDLKDTLRFYHNQCVGMAANMIGIAKNIIIFDDFSGPKVMLNPVILEKSGPYEADEGCLSLAGTRKALRFRNIRVQYQDEKLRKMTQNYSGWTAQIIQHEIDHLSGILI